MRRQGRVEEHLTAVKCSVNLRTIAKGIETHLNSKRRDTVVFLKLEPEMEEETGPVSTHIMTRHFILDVLVAEFT